MIAPCGIEIKVGQVWSRGISYWDVSPKEFLEGEFGDIVRCYRVNCGMILSGMQTVDVKAKQFTNKRGGYRLVKEAPDENADR